MRSASVDITITPDEELKVASLTIRNLDQLIKDELRVRAARNGRSMEAEARNILRDAVGGGTPEQGGLGSRIHQRFSVIGGVDLDVPSRDVPPRDAGLR